MKALGICGSPRLNGNTETLIKRCLTRLEQSGIETEFMPLRDKRIEPCNACTACKERGDGTCAIHDDDFHPIFASMREADIIVLH